MYEFSYENLGDGIEVCVSDEHRFGTDAFLLADFAKARRKDLVCDFCSGNGIVALLVAKNFSPTHIFAVEIQEKAYEQLNLSKQKSNLLNLTPIKADLKEWRSEKELDLITCNPPYKINNTGAKNQSEAVSIARHEVMCTIDDVCKSASKNLKFGGRLCLCNRPERICDTIIAMRSNGIEPKRIRMVSKNSTTAPWLFLIEGKKGAKPFVKIEPQLYVQGDGGFSQEMLRIYGKESNLVSE